MATHLEAIVQLLNCVRCSISGVIPRSPVLAEDGFVYERSAIEEWLAEHSVSPTTKRRMGVNLVDAVWASNMIAKMHAHGVLEGVVPERTGGYVSE